MKIIIPKDVDISEPRKLVTLDFSGSASGRKDSGGDEMSGDDDLPIVSTDMTIHRHPKSFSNSGHRSHVVHRVRDGQRVRFIGDTYVAEIGKGAYVEVIGGALMVRDSIEDDVTIKVLDSVDQNPLDWFRPKTLRQAKSSLARTFNVVANVGRTITTPKPKNDKEYLERLDGVSIKGEMQDNITIISNGCIELFGKAQSPKGLFMVAKGDISQPRARKRLLSKPVTLTCQGIYSARNIALDSVQFYPDTQIVALADIHLNVIEYNAGGSVLAGKSLDIDHLRSFKTRLCTGNIVSVKHCAVPNKSLKSQITHIGEESIHRVVELIQSDLEKRCNHHCHKLSTKKTTMDWPPDN